MSFSWGEVEAGGSNFGDTVIFKSQFEALSQMGAEVGVLSADPKRTKKRYPGVKCFDLSKGRLKCIIAGVMWSDIVIVGGGELVQDISSLFYSPYNLLPLFLACILRKKRFAWAIGIGQGSELAFWTPFFTRLALIGSSGITVRDRGSFNTLYKLGFREPELVLVSDCALTLSSKCEMDSESNIVGAAPRDVSNRSRKLLPLVLRKKLKNYTEPDPGPAAEAWAAILDRHVEKHGSEVVLFPFHTGNLSNDDHSFCELIKNRMKHSSIVSIADPSLPEEFLRLISHCRLLITTPLHGAIMAVATGIVPVSISYASKCTRFMEQAELMEYVPAGDSGIPSKAAEACIDRAWMNSDFIVQRTAEVREQLILRAGKTAEYFRRAFNL